MRGNEFLINYGGEWLDVDAQSVGGFDFTTIWTMDSTRATEKGRTMDLSVPATKLNTRIFNDHKLMCGEGMRRAINGMVVAGGVNITGKIYVTEYSGGRYSLMMAYGHDFEGFGHVNYWSAFLADTITFSGKENPARTGGVPGFGWYEYGNQQSPHAIVGVPPTLHPVTNLGHVIDRLAAALGYSVVYPSPLLGRGYQAHAYGLVLPSFGVQSIQGGADVSGSAMGGFSYTLTGAGTLADLGLEIVTMQVARGYTIQLVDIEFFRATRPVHISIPDGSNVVVFGRNPYDLFNDWEGTQGAEFDLAPGDVFSFARPDEWHMVAGEYYWNRYQMPPAFEGNVAVTFSVTRAAAYPAPGDTMYLAYALPEHPLEWWLDAYCNIIFGSWTVDEDTKTITMKTYGERLGDALADTDKHIDLEGEKMIAVENVKRYIDGFAQHNHTRCAGDYDASLSAYPFDRDLRMNNDYLPQERDMEEIPFNDGGIRGGGDNRYYLDIDDVQDDGNGGYNYNGIMTVFFENTVNSDGAVHLTEILNLGVGIGMSGYDIANAFSASVRLLLPLFRFAQLDGGSCVSFHGRNFVVKNAKWSEGVAQLELVSIGIMTPMPENIDKKYLNFTMPNGGTLEFEFTNDLGHNFEYSFNGENWTSWNYVGYKRTLVLAAGQKVYVRSASDTPTGLSTDTDFYVFSCNEVLIAAGNVNSLLCKNPENAIITEWCYWSLFAQCPQLISAPEFPSKTLAKRCYSSCLYGTAITETPLLPAEVIPQEAYRDMFNDCGNLTKVTTMMTDISAVNCLLSWLYNVAATGDFHCPQSLVIPTGASGIPSGWTRHDI